MKLLMAIIHDEDAYEVMDFLNEAGFSVTKLASTGGFLKSGNTTLICGLEEEKIHEFIEIVEKNCSSRKQIVPSTTIHTSGAENLIQLPAEVLVGGATIFVLDVDRFEKI
ncbi:MAG: cyclic-di-AMP receptor [Lachnospirales bacterium]